MLLLYLMPVSNQEVWDMQKTWLITGVSSGLGRLLAQKALARGDSVIGTSRKADALPDLRERYPQRARNPDP